MTTISIVSIQLVRDREVEYGQQPVNNPEMLYDLFRTVYGEPDRETLVVVALDSQNKPTAISTVSTGTVDASVAHPREVFKTAILANAASIVLIHNHPSGNPQPSPDDIGVTKRMTRVGALVGIPLVDHVIIGDETCVSFKREGYLSA